MSPRDQTRPLDPIPHHRLSGRESFRANGQATDRTLLNFWQWAVSDLLDNTERGILAEYLVAIDLGVDGGARSGWDAFDLTTQDGIRVEVKSAAYVQSWRQKEYSKIIFGIQPTRAWNPDTNQMEADSKRHADAYVFCLLAHKDQATIDPLNIDQWEFFVITTSVLNKVVPRQKSIGLKRLLEIGARRVEWGGIRVAVRDCREG